MLKILFANIRIIILLLVKYSLGAKYYIDVLKKWGFIP